MNLHNFVIKEARPLPVFLLVDTSGSMLGSKIDTVNAALSEMLLTLSHVEGAKGQIKICVITFGQRVNIVQPLENAESIHIQPLTAIGNTPMGAAIEQVISLIEDRTIVPPRSYTPTIVLISDGIPTDCPETLYANENATKEDYLGWRPVHNLQHADRAQNASRLAMGIGQDANYEMLRAFVNKDGVPIIKANDATTIAKFFKWVTLSVSQRSRSVNPNTFDDVPFDDIFGDDELVK